MSDNCSQAGQFHAIQFTVDQSIRWPQILGLCGALLVAAGLCLVPNMWVQGVFTIAAFFIMLALVYWIRRRKTDRAWPVWIDSDAISSLDLERIYTRTCWSDVRDALVVRSKSGIESDLLHLRLLSGKVARYWIPNDPEFHELLSEHVTMRTEPEGVQPA